MTNQIYKAVKSYFTLRYVEFIFTDIVSGKHVCKYVDCFGNVWLKDNRWAFFKVESK